MQSQEANLAQRTSSLQSLSTKAAEALKNVLLNEHRAKVALCLDISRSMYFLYSSGKMQELVDRVLALGLNFDDNQVIDIFLFGERAYFADQLSLTNFSGYVDWMRLQYRFEGGTNYGRVIQEVRNFYFLAKQPNLQGEPTEIKLPTYVIFVTDGAPDDPDFAREQIISSSHEPIFWQFVALGKSRKDAHGKQHPADFLSDFRFLEELDTMKDRFIDNANFFSVEDLSHLSAEEWYKLLMNEYPLWIAKAHDKGILPLRWI
jgi:hypothetical protein